MELHFASLGMVSPTPRTSQIKDSESKDELGPYLMYTESADVCCCLGFSKYCPLAKFGLAEGRSCDSVASVPAVLFSCWSWPNTVPQKQVSNLKQNSQDFPLCPEVISANRGRCYGTLLPLKSAEELIDSKKNDTRVSFQILIGSLSGPICLLRIFFLIFLWVIMFRQ